MKTWTVFTISVLLAACGESGREAGAVDLAGAAADWRADDYVIESGVALQLPPPAVEALERGVALVITVQTRISRDHGWFARQIDADTHHYEIRYLPLSRHYQLTTPDGHEPRSYPRLWMLLEQLAEPAAYPTGLRRGDLSRGAWQVQARAYLDIHQLPSPMRLPAWLSPDWRLTSGWRTWRLEGA